MKIKIAFVCIMTMFICCVLGFNSNAYELQDDGNIKSSNLIGVPPMNITNGNLFDTTIYLDSGTYSFKLYFSSVSGTGQFALWVGNNTITGGHSVYDSISFTIDTSDNYAVRCFVNGSYVDLTCMLNKGTSAIPYEPYGAIWYSDQQYNTLQSQYDTLSQFNLYGWGTYIDSIDVAFSDNSVFNYSKTDLISKNWLTTNGTLNVYQLASTKNPNFGFSTIQISFVSVPPNEASGFPLTLLNISPSGSTSSNLSVVIQDDLGNRKTLDLLDNSYINYQSIYPDLSGALVDYISISGSSPDAFSGISMVGNSGFLYDSGYQVGYNKGKQEGYDSGKQEGYDSGKQEGYDSGYQVGYNKGVSEDLSSSGFSTLFNSILSYPTTMIKEVFNFEFMGINISNLITFIISIGIVAFVIKHFL